MNSTTIAALYTYCAHSHSGQWSRLYRILCRLDKAWRRRAGIGPRLDYWEYLIDSVPGSPVTVLYNRMVEKDLS